ncbi:hypothetical protein [Streptomyces sp. ID05-18]|nr:hypothetical protein [Streptomyces sp. ID05-18]MDX3488218.1 hypothetical protein [Streptomyces sp. ID05-18]
MAVRDLQRLASALRHLHLRAGSPTPWSVYVNSGYALSQELVTALLELP